MKYEDLQKIVKKANQRLKRIQNYTGREVSWTGKQLQSKLDNGKLEAWNEKDLIKISRDMSEIQMARVYKATENFLNSQTSTIRGIKKNIENTKKGFESNLNISESEAEALYQSFEDDLTKWALRYIDSSLYFGIIEEAKENNYSFKRFQDRFVEASNLQIDLDVQEKLKEIYKRYV